MPSSIPTRLQARKGRQYPSTPQHSAFSMEMKSSPVFSTTALRPIEDVESPTPTPDSFAKHDSSTTLRLIRMIHLGRIVLSAVLVAAGAAIIGCEGQALYTYNSTNFSSEWFLPLWPQTLDLRPSVGILVGGAVVVLTSCLYLFCAIMPACSPRFSFLNLLLITLSFLGLAASAFATGFSANIYFKTGPHNRDTIQSWTCRWYDGANDNSMARTNGTVSLDTNGALSSPAGFSRLCLESHAAFDVLVLTLILEIGVVGLSGAAYWLERKLS